MAGQDVAAAVSSASAQPEDASDCGEMSAVHAGVPIAKSNHMIAILRHTMIVGILVASAGCEMDTAEQDRGAGGKADEVGEISEVTATLRFSYFGDTSPAELESKGWEVDQFDDPIFEQTITLGDLPSSVDLMSDFDSLSVSFAKDGTVAIDFSNGDNNTFASVQLPTTGTDSPRLVVSSPMTLSIQGNDNSQFSISGDVVLQPAPSSDLDSDAGDGAQCCRICTTGTACGDSCISADAVCEQAPGCACDG